MAMVGDNTFANKFPSKLWRIVNSCSSGAIGWGEGGRTIIVHQRKFQREYLEPSNDGTRCNIFKTRNMGSFIRQLNLYGFRKLNVMRYNREYQQLLNATSGSAKIAPTTAIVADSHSVGNNVGSRAMEWHEFQNDFFVRNRPDLLVRIRRNVGVRRSREAASRKHLWDQYVSVEGSGHGQGDQMNKFNNVNGMSLLHQPSVHADNNANVRTQLMWAVPIQADNTYSVANAQPVYAHWDNHAETWVVPGLNQPAKLPERVGRNAPLVGGGGDAESYFSHHPMTQGQGQGHGCYGTLDLAPKPGAQLQVQSIEEFPILHIPEHGTTVLSKEDFDKLVTAIADALRDNPETWTAIAKHLGVSDSEGESVWHPVPTQLVDTFRQHVDCENPLGNHSQLITKCLETPPSTPRHSPKLQLSTPVAPFAEDFLKIQTLGVPEVDDPIPEAVLGLAMSASSSPVDYYSPTVSELAGPMDEMELGCQEERKPPLMTFRDVVGIKVEEPNIHMDLKIEEMGSILKSDDLMDTPW